MKSEPIVGGRVTCNKCGATYPMANLHTCPDASPQAEQEPEAVCEKCNGEGWYTESEHDPGCRGDKEYCARRCPVPVQVLCDCGAEVKYADNPFPSQPVEQEVVSILRKIKNGHEAWVFVKKQVW